MIWLRYTSASAHGEVAPLCEFHGSPDAPDVAALLQAREAKINQPCAIQALSTTNVEGWISQAS